MACLILHFQPGNSRLHRWDARCKFFALLLISAILFQPSVRLYFSGSLLLLFLVFLSRLPLKLMLKESRFWALMLLILFLFQVFLTPGPRFSFLPWLPVSQEGHRKGVLIFWRLGLLLGYAFLFTAVTRPRELSEALVWMLKPVPLLPGRRIALMVSLAVKFLSRFLDLAEEVQKAHQSRLGDFNRNPLRKTRTLALPVLRKSILEVNDVSFALLARGYQENLPHRLPPIPLLHLIPLVFLSGMLILTWWPAF